MIIIINYQAVQYKLQLSLLGTYNEININNNKQYTDARKLLLILATVQYLYALYRAQLELKLDSCKRSVQFTLVATDGAERFKRTQRSWELLLLYVLHFLVFINIMRLHQPITRCVNNTYAYS